MLLRPTILYQSQWRFESPTTIRTHTSIYSPATYYNYGVPSCYNIMSVAFRSSDLTLRDSQGF